AGEKWGRRPGIPGGIFIVITTGLCILLSGIIGTELFPPTDTGQVQVRLRLPVGTRLERTEDATRKLLQLSEAIAGKGNIAISSAFIGTQPSSFPINNIHLWTSGPQESVTKIKLKKNSITITAFREQLRAAVKKEIPNAAISFEPGDLAEQVLNLGSTNPVEIIVVNRNLQQGRQTAETLVKQLSAISCLRDVQIATPLNYPAIKLNVDRLKAGQLGITADQVARATTVATSSSRFTAPSYWLDNTTGTAYQVQVQYPEYRVNSTAQLENIPVSSGVGNTHYLNEVASWSRMTVPGEYDRLNQQRYISITANVYRQDLGTVFNKVRAVINAMGSPKGGSKILLRGQPELLQATLGSLQFGLLVAIVVIFLLMAVFFQSFRVALTVLSIIPAVVTGSLLLLIITGQTLNIQSYMGAIMAIGVAIANAVLYITYAEQLRRNGEMAGAYLAAAASRLRPILMTGMAMIAGMLPMALGLGEGGDQVAPLGMAVIGGMVFSMIGVLFFLPGIYQWSTGRKLYRPVSLDPDDSNSIHFEEK
ncbi:MAG TPA: efflux RND transporter permease subunit, partial [Chitinophagaceae bacterium]|nr:efflux RND transporter permease subunit [Chitinophagaceae bacterium]